ncbi:MAG: hypothetical protein Q7U36_03975 [bacterium]|nr:hypothetical protein [bacterium]
MQIIIVVVILAIVLWVFNTTVRNLVNAGVMNTLAWIVSHTPTIGGILVAILAIISIPILLGVGWIGMWTSIGNWALSPMAGWIIAIGGIVGIFFLGWLTRPLIAIAVMIIAFGLCFPTIKGAMNRYSASTEIQIANELDGQALQKPLQGVMPATVIKDAVLYKDNGEITTIAVSAGTEVVTVDLERRQFVGNPEAFAHIMIPSIVGDFKDGSIGWIPVRKLRLGTTPPSTTDNTPAEEKKVIMEVSISGSEFSQNINTLPLGEYEVNFSPVAAAAGATYSVLLPNGGIETKEIKNNFISIKGGEKGCGLWTAIKSKVKISQ